jgi:hypothetical protein
MTDFRALCVELTDCLEKADWPCRYKVVFQQWVDNAHAALAEPGIGSHVDFANTSDGPAVSDDREPTSVVDQLKQAHRQAIADLVRQVIDRALRDTAFVHWRVIDANGTQVVRVSDLLAWAEQTANQMESIT